MKHIYTQRIKAITEDCKQSEELILQVLEHLSAGRNNIDLMRQKLIQAAKNLPIINSMKLTKYY